MVVDEHDPTQVIEHASVEKLRHAGQAVVQTVGQGTDQVAECVRRWPFTSLLVVAGVSCCLGYVLSTTLGNHRGR
jgi:hypothetical protein